MSATRQSITKDTSAREANQEMSTSYQFSSGSPAGGMDEPFSPPIVGDDRTAPHGENNENRDGVDNFRFSRPNSTRNSTGYLSPATGGGSGGNNNNDNTIRQFTRASQMNDEEALTLAVQRAVEEEEKAKEADKKRGEVRSVIRNLYILCKYTNVIGLTVNYLKPIPKGTAAGERLRRTQIISQSFQNQSQTPITGGGGAAGAGGGDADELTLANPPALRRSWPASIIIIFLVLLEFGLAAAYAWAYNHTADHLGDVLYAITEDDKATFDDASQKIMLAAFIGAASNAVYLAIGDFLCFDRFREALTYELIVRYMSDHTHFYLIHLNRDVNDPSARIASDVDTLCEKLKLIVFGTPMYTGYISTTATVVWFSYTLIDEYGWFVFVGTMVFFVSSIVITGLLSIFPTKKLKAQKEAASSFSSLQHYFEAHSEHVAFLRGESAELTGMVMSSKRVTITNRIATLVSLPLNFTTIMFYWGVTFFSALIPGWGYWWTEEPRLTGYDNLSNAVYCVQALMNTMTTYILLAQEYSELAAVLQRVTELILAMQYIEEEYISKKITTAGDETGGANGCLGGDDKPRVMEAGGYYRIRTVEKDSHTSLEVKDVTLFRPNTHNTEPLIEHLSFSLGNKAGEGSLLIMGPSGVGKSSLLRVIAGLWPAMTTDPTNGGIYHPPVQRRGRGSGGMMFLPQRPYLIQDGSLAAQIMYPMTCNEVLTDVEMSNYCPPRDGSSTEASDRGPLLQKGGAKSGTVGLVGVDDDVIENLKKEIFGLLVKVRLGHVARRYSEADWFGIVKAEVDSDNEDDEIAYRHNNKNRLSMLPSSTFTANSPLSGANNGGASSSSYGATQRESLRAGGGNNNTGASGRLTGSRMTVDMASCAVPWDHLLSVGEQQRLAIARVLFHRPHIAIVDEATSAMDEDSEVMCLQALKDLNVKMLSVAHRSTVKAFHDRLLLIKAEGGENEDPDNTELPPVLPMVNRSKAKITYEITDIVHSK